MNRLLFISLALTLSFTNVNAATDKANSEKQRVAESKKVVKAFMGQLKGELQSAMKAGGPTLAINTCKDQAPVIAKNLSDKYGWKVARTSLKTRNPNNAPDTWERSVLEKFEARKNNGEQVKPMAYFETVESNGKSSFRFMKAIPTGEVCLKCHGEDISPKVREKLTTSYPQDMATGFRLGDIRGAFTITQPVD